MYPIQISKPGQGSEYQFARVRAVMSGERENKEESGVKMRVVGTRLRSSQN